MEVRGAGSGSFATAIDWAADGDLGRLAMVLFGELRSIATRLLHQLPLYRQCSKASRLGRSLLGSVRTSIQTAATAVVTHSIVVVVIHVARIDVVDVAAYAGDGAVVIKVVVVPVAAFIAVTEIAVAVVDAAIEANV
ncbi:MAG: hypothetical protein ACRD28_10975, partial [Acidobacteriaceae bacterium]